VRRAKMVAWSALLPALLIAGCAKPSAEGSPQDTANGGDSKPVEITEPVTVKLLPYSPLNDEAYQMLIIEPLAKKYPNITVQRLSGSLDNLLTAGEIPDLVTDWNGAIPNYKNYDLLEDMTPLVKKHNFDLSRFQPVFLDAVRVASDKGELYAIPYYGQLNALFYNKDLFDRFGVPYPPDGMTWDDAVELGKKMTRQENGVQYQGLNYENITRISFPWSPDIVNSKTVKANVNNETWKKIFELAYRIDSIPGNSPNKDFYKGEVAMFATVGDAFQNIKKAVDSQTLNVGVAQYPSYKEMPNTYGMADAHYIFVTKPSKNKDAAMKVIETLTSDEVQLAAAKYLARQSPLKNPEIQKAFGTEYLKGVDMQSIFKSHPAPGTVFHKYYLDSRSILEKQYDEVKKGNKDVNTALRDAEEMINQLLSEKLGADGKKS